MIPLGLCGFGAKESGEAMIAVDRRTLTQIRAHAEDAYPFECCGIVTGSADNREWIVHRCANIQNRLHEEDPQQFPEDARTAYYLDPEEQFHILQESERVEHTIKGFYHSHPDHDAYFSKSDAEKALIWGEPAYPGTWYMVVSVKHGQAKDIVCFAWDENRRTFVRQRIHLLDGGA